MDQQLLFMINRDWTHPVLDYVMAGASSFDLWWPFLLLAGLAAVIWGSWRLRAMLLAIGLAVGVTDALVVDTMKGLVGRPRPHEMVAGVRTLDLAKAKPRLLAVGQPLREEVSEKRLRPASGNSFPSGHAANNFAVAAVCASFYRRRGWLVFLPAILVSYSRIYVGSHWPLDVVVSALIGAGIGFLTVAVLDVLWRKWGEKILPKLRKRHGTLLEA